MVTQSTLPDALGQNVLLTHVQITVRLGVGVCPSVRYISLNVSFVFCYQTSTEETEESQRKCLLLLACLAMKVSIMASLFHRMDFWDFIPLLWRPEGVMSGKRQRLKHDDPTVFQSSSCVLLLQRPQRQFCVQILQDLTVFSYLEGSKKEPICGRINFRAG